MLEFSPPVATLNCSHRGVEIKHGGLKGLMSPCFAAWSSQLSGTTDCVFLLRRSWFQMKLEILTLQNHILLTPAFVSLCFVFFTVLDDSGLPSVEAARVPRHTRAYKEVCEEK